MFELYKSGFYVENNKILNGFAIRIVKLSEEYVKYLIRKGKLISLGDLDSYDIAVDLTAELFMIENGHLVHFKRFFEGVNEPPQTEEEFQKLIHKFVCSSVWHKLTNIFKITDPATNKLHRNLSAAIKENEYLVTDLFTNKFIHRKPINFEAGRCMETGLLLNLLRSKNRQKRRSSGEFLKFVFDAIESQDEYLHTIPYVEILKVYKEYYAFYYNESFEKSVSSPEMSVYLKLFFEELNKNFKTKINKYIKKKNFSQKERECIYSVIEDVINCYINGINRDSVKELAGKYYKGEVTNSLCYKINYVIDMLNSEIIYLFNREEELYARRLSEENN